MGTASGSSQGRKLDGNLLSPTEAGSRKISEKFYRDQVPHRPLFVGLFYLDQNQLNWLYARKIF